MAQRFFDEQLDGAIEAMLFITTEPVSTITLADALEADPVQVQQACERLAAGLAARASGIQLREVAGGWRLSTHPAYHELLESYVVSWDTRRLSQAALEVLAIVAYTQPATRASVASVRGVNSDSSINSLLEKGLLREVGAADAPGAPMQYATTKAFLEHFGLRSLDDLPDLSLFAPDDETRELIRSRLSGDAAEAFAPDAEVEAAMPAGPSAAAADAADEVLSRLASQAIAQAAGVVEKIDFDDLAFDE